MGVSAPLEGESKNIKRPGDPRDEMNEARRGIVTALVRAGRKVREVPLPLTVLARRGAVADVFFSFLFSFVSVGPSVAGA